MAVVDDRFTFISVPAVQLHTAAALNQSPGSERNVLKGSVHHKIKNTYFASFL